MNGEPKTKGYDMRAVLDAEVPVVLRGQYQSCQTGLARVRVPEGEFLDRQAAREIQAAAAQVLAGLRDAGRVALGPRAGAGAPLARFLHRRLDRLAIVSDDIAAAVATGDLPGLRRRVLQFRALAAVLWKVEAGVCARLASPERSTR